MEQEAIVPAVTEEVVGEDGVKPEGQNSEGVVLSSEQYNAVLDHIADLETKLMSQPQGRQEVQKLDALVEEAQVGARPMGRVPNIPIEEMSPQQVLSQLYNSIHTNMIQPLETKIETLRIMNEIDKVAQKTGNEDFWEYAQQVKEIAIKNPTLSIQQAYRLAKTEGGRKPNPSEVGLTKKSGVLFTLPKRPNIAGGEKPGASGSGMKGTNPLTRRDAASDAFDKAMGGKK